MAQDTIKPIPISLFDSSTLIPGTYQLVNTGGFTHPLVFLRIVNDSDNGILISFDGVTDHEYVLANDSFELGNQANSLPNSKKATWPAYTLVYVRGTAGAGAVTVSGYYV